MAELFWKPEQETVPEVAGVTPHSRLVRFLGLSSVLHTLVVVASAWLVVPLSGAGSDRLLVRTIDFVLPPGGSTERAGGGAGEAPPAPSAARAERISSSGPTRVRASKPASVARSAQRRSETVKTQAKAPSTAPTTPAPAPTSPPTEQAVETPPPPPAIDPREAMLAAATPKNVGPSSATVQADRSVAPSASPADPSAIAVLARGAVGEAAGAPVATVAVPPDLVGGRGGAGSGNGTGSGSGTGSGRGGGASTGSGGGSGAGRGAGSGVDTQDPDFSEYFRVIERRVRAAWQFPQTLGGTTQTVKIGFALGPEGSLRQVRVVSSTSPTLDDSALSAMKRAAPFPPLPTKFQTLAGQPLVLSFTVTIR